MENVKESNIMCLSMGDPFRKSLNVITQRFENISCYEVIEQIIFLLFFTLMNDNMHY